MFISNCIVDETVNRSLLKHGSRVITFAIGPVMRDRSLTTGLLASQRTQHINLENISSLKTLRSRVGEQFGIVEPSEITFHGIDGTELHTLGDLSWCKSTIEIRIARVPIHLPPGPDSLSLVGNRFALYPDILGNVDRLCNRYGGVVKTNNMRMIIYYTNDPVIARHVLREGEFFTKETLDPFHPLHFMSNQTVLFSCEDSPAFGPSHRFIPPCTASKAVRHYIPSIQRSVGRAFSVLDLIADGALAFNVYQFMLKLAGQVIWKTVFGADLAHFESLDSKLYKTIHRLGEYLSLMKRILPRSPWYGHLPFGDPRRMREARDLVWAGVGEAIEQACTGGKDLALHEAALHATCLADYLQRAVDGEGNKMPREYLVNNCVILFGAGFVTSSSLLSWCIYALCRYDGVQNRLLQELVDHGAVQDKAWTLDELNNMPYLDRFIKETQRMHNPSFQTARNARRDVILSGGIMIPKASIVVPTFPPIHNSTAYLDKPTRFDPDRWDTEATRTLPRSAYTPFAAGSRGCIGFSLALLEVKIAMALLVYRYEFSDASLEPVVHDPEFLVVRPVNFYATTKRRTCWPVANQTGADTW
ncbi:hypothetical protein PspLS_10159 [Pyricularia sp. CBS 133598]|nr:hypothetical protein PspLS_10159 [Pyricularia sp. CBS 133598]